MVSGFQGQSSHSFRSVGCRLLQCLHHVYIQEVLDDTRKSFSVDQSVLKNGGLTDCCTNNFQEGFDYYMDQNTTFKR